MLRLSSICAVAVCIFAGGCATTASAALVSCFKPNNRIAGRLTPNPRGFPIIAHKKLPFGTIVRLSTRKGSVDSIVKDRGPFKGKREYDAECWVLTKLGIDGVGNARAEIIGR
jgi:hypothetical protein